jgi:hypothetical protein
MYGANRRIYRFRTAALILSPCMPNSAPALLRTILDIVRFAATTTALHAGTTLYAGAALRPAAIHAPSRAYAGPSRGTAATKSRVAGPPLASAGVLHAMLASALHAVTSP